MAKLLLQVSLEQQGGGAMTPTCLSIPLLPINYYFLLLYIKIHNNFIFIFPLKLAGLFFPILSLSNTLFYFFNKIRITTMTMTNIYIEITMYRELFT